MNERELFENNEFVKTIIHRYEWSDEFNNYQIKDCVINGSVFNFIEAERDQPILNGAWFGWQVSVQREGYKLVPVELVDEIEDKIWDNLSANHTITNQEGDGFIPIEDIDLGGIYKAMIGVADE